MKELKQKKKLWKQLLGCVVTLCLLLTMGGVSEQKALAAVGDMFTAQTTEGVAVTYKILTEPDANGAGTVQVGNGSNCAIEEATIGTLTIPETVANDATDTTYTVTGIGNEAFENCAGLTTVTIPDSVTSIGKHTFNQCDGLTDIVIPDSVTSIGEFAFYHCDKLTTVTLPNTITSIEASVFNGCKSLNNITIPESVTSIGSKAFYGCTSLTQITIPGNVTSIDARAFQECTSLTQITIPSKVTRITDYTFSGCTSLKQITIPGNVTSMMSNSFENCTSLERVNAPCKWEWKEPYNPFSDDIVYIAEHTWGYETDAAGTTITAVCSKDYCQKTEVLTISAEDAIYDGTAHVAELSAETIAGVTPQVQYEKKTGEATWAEATTEAPVDAGTYRARVTVGDKTAMVEYTIGQATPTVQENPGVVTREYHPAVALEDTDFTADDVSIAVYGIDGSTLLTGTWSWSVGDAPVVPNVGNTGYLATFLPHDTNYKEVTTLVAVPVTKAVPYLNSALCAEEISYGQTVGTSELSDATAQHSESADITVEGTFTWEASDAERIPMVGNSTTYTVVFTPTGAYATNYEDTTAELTVPVAAAIPSITLTA